jgi:hypothetical protein
VVGDGEPHIAMVRGMGSEHGAPTCTVTVQTQFAVKVDGARRPYLVRGRTQKWTLARMKTRAPAIP